MKIFRGYQHPALAHQCALTIGNFDGVHRGHQEMLALLKNEAQHRGVPSCVMTFEPHPRDYFAAIARKPELAPARIATLRDKLTELARCGIDQCVVLPFNSQLSSQSPDNFIQAVLVQGLGAKHYVNIGCSGNDGRAFLTRYAAADADQHAFFLQVFDAAQIAENFFLRLLAHRASVEQNQVSLFHVLCRLIAIGCAQNVLHFVRVVLVHLAAEGFDKDFFGHGRCYLCDSCLRNWGKG